MKTERATPKVKKFNYKKIKTFNDACKLQGVSPDDLPTMPVRCKSAHKKAIISGYKLMIITAAINNDEKFPDFSNTNQYKYFPWPNVSSSCLVFSFSYYGCDFANANVGFPLCFNEREKALYCFKQFNDLWKEWLLGI
jgi:hypothetical protein